MTTLWRACAVVAPIIATPEKIASPRMSAPILCRNLPFMVNHLLHLLIRLRDGVSDDGILRQKEFNAKIGKPQQDFEMNADPAGLYKPNLV
jgi:hypothetical protein